MSSAAQELYNSLHAQTEQALQSVSFPDATVASVVLFASSVYISCSVNHCSNKTVHALYQMFLTEHFPQSTSSGAELLNGTMKALSTVALSFHCCVRTFISACKPSSFCVCFFAKRRAIAPYFLVAISR